MTVDGLAKVLGLIGCIIGGAYFVEDRYLDDLSYAEYRVQDQLEDTDYRIREKIEDLNTIESKEKLDEATKYDKIQKPRLERQLELLYEQREALEKRK